MTMGDVHTTMRLHPQSFSDRIYSAMLMRLLESRRASQLQLVTFVPSLTATLAALGLSLGK